MAVTTRRAAPARRRLRLDPIVCDGHGICAELLPERISLDDWGYPIVDQTPIEDGLLPHARRAVEACPVLALRLERIMKGDGERGPQAPGHRQAGAG